MEEALEHFFAETHWSLLFASIAASLYVLGKGADWLVDEAVELSEKLHIPQMVVGATIVSLGTTAPEAAASVLASAFSTLVLPMLERTDTRVLCRVSRVQAPLCV